MIILKFIKWFADLLNGTHTPRALALGMVLGMILGLVPFGLVSLLLLIVALILNCQFSTVLFLWGIFAALRVAGLEEALTHPFGHWLIETGPHGFFSSLASSESLSLLALHRSSTAGGLGLGLILAIPLYFGFKRLVVTIHKRWGKAIANSKLIKAARKVTIVRWGWMLIGGTR